MKIEKLTYMSVKELSNLYGELEATIYQALKKGFFRRKQISTGNFLINKNDFIDWLGYRKNKVTATKVYKLASQRKSLLT